MKSRHYRFIGCAPHT